MSEGNYEVTVRPEKAAVVEEMKEQLSSQGVVLVAYNKLGYAAPPHIPEAWRAVQSY